jgi:hypothetical protein
MGRVVRSIKHGWNAFKRLDEPGYPAGSMAPPRPNRSMYGRFYSNKSIIGSIYNRLAIDVAQVEFYHAMLDENDIPIEVVRDSLNDCLTLNPNIDQSAQAFKIDYALTLFERGHIAVCPVEASLDPSITSSYNITDMRVAPILDWRTREVVVDLYDDRDHDEQGNPVGGGVSKQVSFEKRFTAIVENPFYSVMNEANGTLQRLKAKLALLDGIDEAAGSGKLDMIIQLPYAVRGESRSKQAQERRDALRSQLKDDELGIGYVDVNEKIIQLNRPIDNKLLDQIKELYDATYAELGLTREIMNGTASRDAINNYFDRTIEPIANALREEYKRKFLTKTARTQRHSIEMYRDPLKVIQIGELAEIMDKGTRSNVMTPNDIRPRIGLRPSKDPLANRLGNPNMPIDDQIPRPPAKEVGDEGLPG